MKMRNIPFEIIAYGILLIGLLTIALIPMDRPSNGVTKFCHIDSISVDRRYEVMPQLDKTYWTDCGTFPAGNTNLQVGDSIEIKIIRYEK
jgi:hypothetical protein